MNFEFNADQRAVLDVVDRLLERHAATPMLAERWQYSAELARDLQAAGLFDAINIEELGTVAACAAVMALAHSPLCAETAAASLLAPWLCPELPGPHAVLWERDDAATRFLPMARTVIRVRGQTVDVAAIRPEAGLPARRRAEVLPRAVLPEAVVGGPLLLVAQGGVGFAYFLELLLGVGFLGDVGVILACELAVGLLDFILAGAARHAEGLVVVLVFHDFPVKRQLRARTARVPAGRIRQ